jgi:5'-nucleotidase (lipoprotein e(P4) family)
MKLKMINISLLFVLMFFSIKVMLADSNSLYYMNKSQEYQGVTTALYNLAYVKLKDSLTRPEESAFPEQVGNYQDLPVAVILDIDETILNTSAYAIYLEKTKQKYTEKTWDTFLKQADAPAVAGAVRFIHDAQALGVTIFLVSNREESQREYTVANLEKLGLEIDNENILLKNQEETYTSNKYYRYVKIAKTHRIAMIIGDDLNDFFPAKNIHYKGRQIYFKKYEAYIGNSWIFLPNPSYGSFVDEATADLKENEAILDLMQGFNEKKE